MFKDLPNFKKPENENAKIWRYMDFPKFVDLLDKSALFFPRADKLGDPFEGSFPKGNIVLRPVTYNISKQESTTLSEYYKQFVKFTIISCWHLNEYESAAMWKLYLKSDEGIAIQSNFSRIKSSIMEQSHTIYIHEVEYLDYKIDLMHREGSLSPFFHKRKSFEHERELRIIIQEFSYKKDGSINWAKSPFSDGMYIPVDLDTLIDNIYLAPTSPKWILELVKSITKSYRLNKEVIPSALNDEALY